MHITTGRADLRCAVLAKLLWISQPYAPWDVKSGEMALNLTGWDLARAGLPSAIIDKRAFRTKQPPS
jgi:hypothetical protein